MLCFLIVVDRRKGSRNLQEPKGGILVIELQIDGGCVVGVVVVKINPIVDW